MAKLLLKTFLFVQFCFVFSAFTFGQCIVTASNDTTVCISAPTIQLNAMANNTLGYEWTPTNGLNNSRIANPIAKPTITTSYIVTAVIPDNTELVVNGDFESGNTGFTSAYTYTPTAKAGSKNLNAAQYVISKNPSLIHNCFAACKDKTTGTGNMIIYNGSNSTNVGVWSQTINVQQNTDYAFSAWLQNVTCPPFGYNAELQFSINGVLIGSIFRSDSAICIWKQFYQVWNSGSNTSATISIVNQYTSLDGNDFALDDISFRKLCPARDTVTITIDVPKNTINKQICSGDSLFVQGKYQKVAGTYKDIFITSKGCDSIVTTNLTVGTLSNTINKVICTGDSIFLENAYRKNSGSYIDTLSSIQGCDSILTTNLSLANNLTTLIDTIVCSGDSVLINGRYIKQTGTYYDTLASAGKCNTIAQTNLTAINTTFSSNAIILCGNDSFLFSNSYLKTSGIYYDTVYQGNCPLTISQLNLTKSNIAITNINFTFCADDSISYLGNFYKTDTTFYDTISKPPFCDSIIITTLAQAKKTLDATDTAYYCDDIIAQLDAGAGFINYVWNNGTSSRFVNSPTEGKYWVEVTDSNNCKFTDTAYVFERCDPIIFIPSSFSPNNDGLNDAFFISSSNIYAIDFIIFDRWGEILFETKNPQFVWNGTYKGKPLPTEIYHWIATFTGINKEGRIVKQTQKGILTLLH